MKKIEKLHLEFRRLGQNALEWRRRCVLMLPEIFRERVWEAKGFASIYEYAAKLAGLSRSAVDDGLWLMKKVEGKEKLMEVVEKKGVNAVRPIVSLVNEENEEFWAEKAMEMSVNTLRIFAQDFRNVPKNTADSGRKKAKLEIDVKNFEELEKLKGSLSWDEFFEDLMKLKRAQIAEEKKIIAEQRKNLERPEPVQSGSRYIPKSISRYVEARAKLQTREKILNGARPTTAIYCEFPHCFKEYEQRHHTRDFATHHLHDPNQIYCLCREHHNLMHHALIADEELGPEHWRIRKRKLDFHGTTDREYIDQRVRYFQQAVLRL